MTGRGKIIVPPEAATAIGSTPERIASMTFTELTDLIYQNGYDFRVTGFNAADKAQFSGDLTLKIDAEMRPIIFGEYSQ